MSVVASRCPEHDLAGSAGYEIAIVLLHLGRLLNQSGLIRDDLPLVPVLGHHDRAQTLGLLGRPLVDESENYHGDVRLEETDLLDRHLGSVFFEPGLEQLRPEFADRLPPLAPAA